ncbi:YDG/SRA domain-containing protein [Streptomyces sp. NPDC006872]|uniref:YDG/SRA domain-containing protein n=1 Tax=Streptomyces sp. NPDC006872 TaxID=3155720 RepID=UPI0033C9E2B5
MSFALDLRDLRDASQGAVEAAVMRGASRTAVYAALNGARLPSVQTLDAMIDAWTHGGEAERRRWQERRRDAEEALAEASRLRGDATTRRTPEEADFTERLRAVWQEGGSPSTEAVARHCGLSARTLDSYLEGRTLPTTARLRELLDGLSAVREVEPSPTSPHDLLVDEALFRARTARKEERDRVRQLATALPGGQPASPDASYFDGLGAVAGVRPGQTFATRRALAEAGVHRHLIAGIAGRQDRGAESVVVSDASAGDDDYGDVIIYTGEGTLDLETGRQARDQQLTRGNAALATSVTLGAPVRVVRRIATGRHTRSYRYDGLFKAEDYWSEQGPHGYRVWRFRLVRLPAAEQSGNDLPTSASASASLSASAGEQEARPDDDRMRSALSVQRIVRSTAIANLVKRMHDYTCQVCGTRLQSQTGGYAEAAHIRPLGSPHDGPDAVGNVLCLCPNCHVRLDQGMLIINDDLTVVNRADSTLLGRLRETAEHRVDREQLAYHRVRYGLPGGGVAERS